MLTDLADAARKSGLRVIELDHWERNASAGGEDYKGVLCHHTGSYDSLTDSSNDLDYARWMAFSGRSDLDPPLCNLALSAECVVYVCAAGNANHAGEAKESGPMPAATDGNRLYVGIEAMNSGSQGWGSKGRTKDGEEITQGEAYARLCAALCRHYGWPADHVRAHRETSLTGKWDPGGLDMDAFRHRVGELIEQGGDDMPYSEAELVKLVRQGVREELQTFRENERKRHQRLLSAVQRKFNATQEQLDEIQAEVDDE
jgi:N-acetyl-anhydromuramyl-L-alanine amidase AmpD